MSSVSLPSIGAFAGVTGLEGGAEMSQEATERCEESSITVHGEKVCSVAVTWLESSAAPGPRVGWFLKTVRNT